MKDVKYPQVKVQLVGQDGNAFSIIGRVLGEMRKAGLSDEQRKEFIKEATSGDYNHLLQTVMKFVTVDEYYEGDGGDDDDGRDWDENEEESYED